MQRRHAPGPIATTVICALLAGVFAVLSYSAALQKSATMDEPLHFASAAAAAFQSDYRVDPENPPIWKYWAMLPIRRDAVRIVAADPAWRSAAASPGRGDAWAVKLLYRTPGTDGAALINAARGMMLLIGVLTLAATAALGYRIGGGAVAIAAAFLIAFDPTFLAHAPLVKNDVVMAFLMICLAAAIWNAGRRLSVLNACVMALTCGIAINCKLSGVVYPFIAVVLLGILSLTPATGPTLLGHRTTRKAKLANVAFACVFVLVGMLLITWASYRFTYAISPDAEVQRSAEARVDDGARSSGSIVRAIAWIDHHRLLPQGWTAGLLALRDASLNRPSYLAGQVRWGGNWWYFPFAFVVKTPVAILGALVLAVGFLIVPRLRRLLDLTDGDIWTLTCLLTPPVIYLAVAMGQQINQGVRHLLPIYPLLFLAIAFVAGRAARSLRKPTLIVASLFAIALAAESLFAWPSFIPFFNVAAGGSRGGIRLLGDSNLDWGQDLPLLAAWQRQHPGEKLYLCYFGSADPASYGIDYTNLPAGYAYGPPAEPVTTPGVIAVSATRLQGLYMNDELATANARLLNHPVREVLGGSIYLFDFPFRDANSSASKSSVRP